jgi:hypothetical protein
MWEREAMAIKFHVAGLESEECVVSTFAYGLAGVEGGASLADEDLAREDVLVWWVISWGI